MFCTGVGKRRVLLINGFNLAAECFLTFWSVFKTNHLNNLEHPSIYFPLSRVRSGWYKVIHGIPGVLFFSRISQSLLLWHSHTRWDTWSLQWLLGLSRGCWQVVDLHQSKMTLDRVGLISLAVAVSLVVTEVLLSLSSCLARFGSRF